IPGSIFLAAGILYLVLPNPLTGSIFGPAVIVIAAFLATVATIPYYKKIAPVHRPMSSIPMSLEGLTGVVVQTVEPNNIKGKVRVKSEIWSARSDRTIPIGAIVKVLGGEGVAIQVTPVDEKTPN
ncbi:MAG TPA: NfeD family protein, partial [Thermoplasmata archaeon]|nr:NfeD family protein [Thermoplasmata archaeon]